LSLFRLIFLHAHYHYYRLYIPNLQTQSNHRTQNLKATTSTANMLAKTVFAATFFALAQFAVASPPGCLLGAVNQYTDPSDLKTVCQSKDLTTQVAKFCGDDTKAALSAVADICNGQGVKVCTYNHTTNNEALLKGKEQMLIQPQRPTSLPQPVPSSPAALALPLLHPAPAASTLTPPTTALLLLRLAQRLSPPALVPLVLLAHLLAALRSLLALLASSRLASLLLSLVSWLSLCREERPQEVGGRWGKRAQQAVRRDRCICI
jgi:hypothetical protein